MNRKILGSALKERRKQMKESLESLADEYISAATIGNLERGLPNVSEEKIIYYAKKIGMGGELFGIISEAEKQEKEIESELIYLEDVISGDVDNSLQRLEKEFAFLHKNSRLSAFYHFLLGRCYFSKRENNRDKMLNKAERHFSEVLRLVDETDLSNLKIAALNELSRISYYQHNLNNALKYTEQGLGSFKEGGQRLENRYYLLINQATYLEQLGEDEKALKTLEELWDSLSSIGGTKILSLIGLDTILQMYIIFAGVLTKAKHYKSALEFANEGVDIARNNGRFDKIVLLWTSIGNIQDNLGDIYEAEKYYAKALSVREKVSEDDIFFTLTSLGKLYIKNRLFEKAHSVIKDSVSIAKNNKDEMATLDAMMLLGNCYLEQGLFMEAIPSFTTAYNLSSKYNSIKKQNDAIISLCYVYKKIEDITSYKQCLEKMFELQASMKWGT
jgi:tetratricopeptide (TPR) repeat protein